MTKKTKRLDPDEECPCGSGECYGDCCWEKEFSWARGADGTIYREVPVTQATHEALSQLEADFEHVFRRKPQSQERMNAGVYINSEADHLEQVAKALTIAGIDKAKAYATLKTGLIPVQGREGLLTDKEMEEWEDAIEEYENRIEGEEETSQGMRDALLDDLDPEILRFPYLMGMFIQECPPHIAKRPASEDPYRAGAVFFYATRALKTFEGVQTLTKYNLGEDALTLVRSLYESYLHLIYVLREPTAHGRWMRARLGLYQGTHEFKVGRSGKVNYNRIVDQSSGEEIHAHVSTRAMADASPFESDRLLQRELYASLSRYAHPHPVTIRRYLSPDGWDFRRRDMILAADVLGYGVALLALDACRRLDAIPEQRAEDISVYLRHAGRAFVAYVDFECQQGLFGPDVVLLRDRVERLGEPWPVSDAEGT